jgi:activator of HSP90 ATPase
MKAVIKLSANFPVTAKRLYDSWLSSSAHSNFTGGKAVIDGRVGGKFKAWDGYISGSILILQPYGRIVQTWRTTEFPEIAPDSRLEILFEKHNSETKITLIHTQVPNGQERKYEKGWKENYFKPMKKFFKKK